MYTFIHYIHYSMWWNAMNIVTGYDKVLNQLDDIIKTLQLNPGARDKLTRLYQREKWLDIAATPTEGELVRLALLRIEQDPSQFDLFIDMLRDTEGMDLIVTALTGGELMLSISYKKQGGWGAVTPHVYKRHLLTHLVQKREFQPRPGALL